MESPFFRNYVKPFRTFHTPMTPRNIPVQPKSSPPDVISIPIDFVGSEKSRSTAARRIQNVFRGFLVRKNVKKIVGIKKEVDEIEKKISVKETADLIRKDAKERLKMNEMLMALLFRLDSVRGVDSGVRDCRKAVIKKAILLQEKLDAIASGESEDQQVDSVVESEDQIGQLHESEFDSSLEESNVEEKLETVEEALNTENVITESLKEEDDETQIQQADSIHGSLGTGASRDVEVERQDENKVLMERMMETNDILLGMVADLCERNKMQTQMINSLASRVDNLEKSFKSERSKRKKRRQIAGAGDANKP